MLPEHYYKAEHVGGAGNDKAFITEQLEKVNYQQAIKGAQHYSDLFLNLGRSQANTRLRKYVEKCIIKNNGCTIKPAIV